MSANLLVVAALDEEVAHVPAHADVLVTGVGKTRAATLLTRRLASGLRPDLVVNVGTAGAVDGELSGLVEVDWVTQHDFPYDAIQQLVGRSLDRGFLLAPGAPPRPMPERPDATTALATGDVFVASADDARRLAAEGIHLVDMEAYGYASACAEFAVAFRCVKVVSDGANEDAGLSWLDTIDACARSLGDWVAEYLASLA